ncbi:hypothetical protein F4859DRAFT_217504 [Xylaria cf. heliscus]|nr:hypothetical protein F4859DRAFT_217504 [Xylaria cf. heliscus]
MGFYKSTKLGVTCPIVLDWTLLARVIAYASWISSLLRLVLGRFCPWGFGLLHQRVRPKRLDPWLAIHCRLFDKIEVTFLLYPSSPIFKTFNYQNPAGKG